MTIRDKFLFCRFFQSDVGQAALTQRLFALVLLAGVLLQATALRAEPLQLPPEAIRSGVQSQVDLWIDTTGKATPETVTTPGQAGVFTRLTGPLSLGFTDAVAWVRVSLTSPQDSRWLLEVGQPILEDVRLYQRGPDGVLAARYGTASSDNWADDLPFRKPVFQLDLKAHETAVFYLRLSSRTALVTDLKLWTPSALTERVSQESFIWGLVFGAYFLVMLFYFAFWAWTRERVHLYYVLYVATNFGAALMTGRWIDMVGLRMDTQTHTMILGLLIGLTLWIGPVFTVSFLGAHRIWPRLSRVFLRSCMGVSFLGMTLVLLGYYSQGVMSVQLTSMLVIMITLVASAHLAWKGDKRGQLLLLAFSLFYIGVVWRYMRNIGLIEPTWWNESVYQVGAFVHMMVMSTAIFSNYNTLRRKSEQNQARANAQEMQRQRQYEFLGMVSHEVRTPLTVITASADNLLLDSSVSASTRVRVEKIIRHCGKLQHLFDTYLDNERLLNGDKPITLEDVDLMALCEGTVQDIRDTHGIAVTFESDFLPRVICNPDLVKVAISNLLENARKHSADTVGIQLHLRRSGSWATISVTDQGKGVDEEDMPFIFDAYYRGKGAYPSNGSGLGLHLVKFIAEQHKGRVHAVKLEPRGMQFVFEIPISSAPSGI